MPHIYVSCHGSHSTTEGWEWVPIRHHEAIIFFLVVIITLSCGFFFLFVLFSVGILQRLAFALFLPVVVRVAFVVEQEGVLLERVSRRYAVALLRARAWRTRAAQLRG
jgi:hypothetical protein